MTATTATAVDHGRARRDELAAFLRSRRDRLAPEAVGLPRGRRRRAPGLRREEVAQLAGVGVTWYTWLEQGRSINVSAQVLSAVARALRLSDDERDHLFTLAGLPRPGTERADDIVTSAVYAILDSLEPLPAHVVTARYDVVAWNPADGRLLGDFAPLPPHRRNLLWLMFTEPVYRDMFGGWDSEMYRQLVGRFRRTFAAHVDEPAWQALVTELSARSPAFRKHWERHEVTSYAPSAKTLVHPLIGPIRLAVTSLWIADQPGARIVVYAPLDQEGRDGLERLNQRAPWVPWTQQDP
jgi:transcriptional regulator with XRE-family HTH domain